MKIRWFKSSRPKSITMETHHNHDGNKEEESHVHFPVDQLAEHADIMIKPGRAEHSLDIHLGFLQIKHVYQIKFNIKDTLGEDVSSDPLQNLNVHVTEISPSEDGLGHHIVMEFTASKEKLQHEKILLQSVSDSSNQLTLLIHGRVLGKGKGTPSLKTGIHVLRVELDEDSEQSDWAGFS